MNGWYFKRAEHYFDAWFMSQSEKVKQFILSANAEYNSNNVTSGDKQLAENLGARDDVLYLF